MITKSQFKEFWNRVSNHPATAKVMNYARRIIVLAVVAVIIYQLFDIGWKEVLSSLPTQPAFYLLFIFLYFTLPVAEIFIYRQIWQFPPLEGFKTFLKKKVYNEELVGYSGEVHLFMWGRRHVNKKDKEILKNIRDNAIISSMTSNLVAVGLIAFLILGGYIALDALIGELDLLYTTVAIVLIAVLIALLIYFRKYLFDLPARTASVIFAFYMVRFLIHHGLLMAMWAIVIPGTPLSVWFTFLALVIVINRVPFLPSKDLVFVWAGIELSHMLEMASAAVAGMLLVYSVLKKVTNLALFLLLSYYFKEVNDEEVAVNKASIPFSEANKERKP